MDFYRQFFSSDFTPHGFCYLWDPRIVWLNVISDGLIALSYYCIPLILIYFIRKNRDLPFNKIFWMFGTFILACGTTHIMEIWNVWHGNYLLAGVIKAITAAVSVLTAAMLIPLVPKVISLPERAHLQKMNRDLERQIAERNRLDAPIDAPLRRKVTAGFVFAIVLTIFLGYSGWRSARRAAQDDYWVSHTHEVMETIQRLSRHAIVVETSARAFALTGQEPLLVNYQNTREKVSHDEAELRSLTTDNLSQQRRLKVLDPQVHAALDFAESIIVKRRQSHAYPGGNDALETERRIDVVTTTTRDMYAEETRLLNERTRRAAAGQLLTKLVAIVGALLGVGLWVLARIAVQREIDISARARAQLSTLNAELEHRVEQRTAALQAEVVERSRAQEISERLAAVVESSDDAIISQTLDGTITAWNRGAEKLFGYPSSEAVGRSIGMLMPPAQANEVPQILARIGRGESVRHLEAVRVRKDGTFIDVSGTISPIRDSSGVVAGASKIARDTTERKQIDATLKKSLATSEMALKELADQRFALDQHAIVAVTDVQGTISYVNDKFCTISQYLRAELIGQNHRILNSGHHPREFFQQMYRTIASGKVWHGEIRNRAKDGSIYWVDTTIVPFVAEDGKPRQYVAIRADITERKRAEETVKESLVTSENALKDLADQKFALDQHAIVAMTDVQGAITYVNEKFCAISQYSQDELIGQNHRILNSGHHPKEFFQQMYHAIANGKVWHGEIKNRAKDGSIYWVDTTIVPTLSAAGKPRQYVAIRADITERKRAEEMVKESLVTSQNALKELADQKFALDQHAIVAVTDVQGTITYVNDKFCTISKYSRNELIGQNHRILNSGHHPREFFQQMYHSIAKGKVWHGEIKNRAKDGSIYWVDTTVVPFMSAEGKPLQYVAIRADITERRLAAETLREQSQILELAQVLVRDMQNRIVLWNLGAEKLYGFTKQQAVGRISHELLQTEFPAPIGQIEEQFQRTGSWAGELVHRKRDGGRIVVSSLWVLHRDGKGEPARVLEANTDITGRKDAEQRLAAQAEDLSRQAEELAGSRQALESKTLTLRSVLDSMVEGLVATDEEGKFVLWNPAAEQILGMRAANVGSEEWTAHYGLYLPDTITPFPAEQIPLVRALRGEASTTEMFVRNPEIVEGAWIEVSAGPMFDKAGTISGGVAAFRDITQRRTDEREILRLNEDLELRVIERTAQLEIANKELESFSYSVSHDLRAPLRHIIGFSKMLVEEFGPTLDPGAKHYLDRIQAGTQKMGLLVDELLNLAKVGRHAVNRQITDLKAIVEEVVAILEPDLQGREVQWVIADLPLVECDPVLVKQIFQNLLANALKFTRARTPAIIHISHQENTDAGQPVLVVRDNGIGFDMKYVDKLFGVFQRLHRPEDFEGTGIGLATVQRIVLKHDGRVWAEGEVDKGAAFYFTLGVEKQSESESETKTNEATAGGQS
jgi:PAS domain S-box-containing protein